MFTSLVSRLLKRPAPTSLEPVKTVKRKCSSQAIFKPLVWIDCEMTGLDVAKDHIIEICCIITDGDLNIIDETGYESTVYVPKKVLDNMNEWCITHHGQSGLTAKILANPQQTLAKVQQELLEYIQSYISEPRTSLLAGNSVHMDKFFMMKEFPQVIEHLHYRLVDVSSIMEVGYRHNPTLMKMCPKKKGSHTARSDILESIEQLRWYRSNYLRSDIPDSLNATTEPELKKPKLESKETPQKTQEDETAGIAEEVPTLKSQQLVVETVPQIEQIVTESVPSEAEPSKQPEAAQETATSTISENDNDSAQK